jgi:hypothetical protein
MAHAARTRASTCRSISTRSQRSPISPGSVAGPIGASPCRPSSGRSWRRRAAPTGDQLSVRRRAVGGEGDVCPGGGCPAGRAVSESGLYATSGLPAVDVGEERAEVTQSVETGVDSPKINVVKRPRTIPIAATARLAQARSHAAWASAFRRFVRAPRHRPARSRQQCPPHPCAPSPRPRFPGITPPAPHAAPRLEPAGTAQGCAGRRGRPPLTPEQRRQRARERPRRARRA